MVGSIDVVGSNDVEGQVQNDSSKFLLSLKRARKYYVRKHSETQSRQGKFGTRSDEKHAAQQQ